MSQEIQCTAAHTPITVLPGRFGLLGGVIGGPLGVLGEGLAGLVIGLLYRLVVGLAGLAIGFAGGLIYGGRAVLQHYTLRWLLYRNGSLPLRLVPFLDYCTERIFLRKVDGGYIFVHRLLMEHFALLGYEHAVKIAREIGDRCEEKDALNDLAEAHVEYGDTRKAIDYYEQALAIARELGDRYSEVMTAWNLGLALEKQGHPDAEADLAGLEQLQQQLADRNDGRVPGGTA